MPAASEYDKGRLESGEWFEIKKEGLYLCCCDCGLIHTVIPKIKKGRVWVQFIRNNRATGQRRRWLNAGKKETKDR